MDSVFTHILLFLVPFLAGGAFLFIKIKQEKSLKLLLSFSGAFLFGLTILHFLPEVFQDYKPSLGLFILIGFSIQLVLEFLTQGIDHGHYHKGHSHKIQIPALVGLFLHALFEATPLAEHQHASGHQHDFHYPFMMGLILHKLPVAIVFGSMLSQLVKKKLNGLLILGLFSLMAPLGLLLSEEIVFFQVYHDYFMAIVVGIFLYISTTILFEISENHKFNIVKFSSIILGFGIAAMISLL